MKSPRQEHPRKPSPLFEAVVQRDFGRVTELLARGADPDEEDGPSGQRPLLAAAADGQVQFVRALLAAGADVNATDRHGNTALSNVVFKYTDEEHDRYVSVLDVLLEHSADPDKGNRHGVSPRTLAATIGSSNIQKVLDASLTRIRGGGHPDKD